MSVETDNFTTGPAIGLAEIGDLRYNGCSFSPLYETKMSGVAIKDNAQRTVKNMEYTLTADGYVTLPTGDLTISPTMSNLRKLLTAQGGNLVYVGRGFDLIVNPTAGQAVKFTTEDVAWGPVPELLEFQPLGGGRSAKVMWTCKIRIPEIPQGLIGKVKLAPGKLELDALRTVLQFNYESSLSYDEAGYSTVSVSGTLEIPLTRAPSQTGRSVPQTADEFRPVITDRIMSSIDLVRFRVIRREFKTSRDKRTLEWDFALEEHPPMELPPDCTIANGTYSTRPAHSGMGLCNWLCSLRVTYTVRKDLGRRLAWINFLALLRLRMKESILGYIPPKPKAPQQVDRRGGFAKANHIVAGGVAGGIFGASGGIAWRLLTGGGKPQQQQQQPPAEAPDAPKAWIIDFSFDEGLYQDSKTTSFSATWKLVTTFSHILLGSGIWKKLPTEDAQGNNLWALSVKDISGDSSWLTNQLDPSLDAIVDFGGD